VIEKRNNANRSLHACAYWIEIKATREGHLLEYKNIKTRAVVIQTLIKTLGLHPLKLDIKVSLPAAIHAIAIADTAPAAPEAAV
jgi:hypothetical protein